MLLLRLFSGLLLICTSAGKTLGQDWQDPFRVLGEETYNWQDGLLPPEARYLTWPDLRPRNDPRLRQEAIHKYRIKRILYDSTQEESFDRSGLLVLTVFHSDATCHTRVEHVVDEGLIQESWHRQEVFQGPYGEVRCVPYHDTLFQIDRYGYDDNGRMVQMETTQRWTSIGSSHGHHKDHRRPRVSKARERFAYEVNGRIKKYKQGWPSAVLKYDATGRLIEAEDRDMFLYNALAKSYEYDESGRVARIITKYAHHPKLNGSETRLMYDSLGYLVGLEQRGDDWYSAYFTYEEGRLVNSDRTNYLNGREHAWNKRYEYNEHGLIERIVEPGSHRPRRGRISYEFYED